MHPDEKRQSRHERHSNLIGIRPETGGLLEEPDEPLRIPVGPHFVARRPGGHVRPSRAARPVSIQGAASFPGGAGLIG
jgi:hypothetical protein